MLRLSNALLEKDTATHTVLLTTNHRPRIHIRGNHHIIRDCLQSFKTAAAMSHQPA